MIELHSLSKNYSLILDDSSSNGKKEEDDKIINEDIVLEKLDQDEIDQTNYKVQ